MNPKDLINPLFTQPARGHGIARETIPWFPTVNHDKCIGGELCFVTCRCGG